MAERAMELVRCSWCGSDPLYTSYHDEVWGVPLHDDRALFELLVLEGAQAGLSWITILRRWEGYRAAFAGLEPERVAAMGEADIERLRQDERIIRNRAKIASAVTNARALLDVQAAEGSFDRFIWSFVEGRPVQNQWRHSGEVPASTPLSTRISKELRRRGFSFVGPTIVYAYMQAAGLVNDHLVHCFRHAELGGQARP